MGEKKEADDLFPVGQGKGRNIMPWYSWEMLVFQMLLRGKSKQNWLMTESWIEWNVCLIYIYIYINLDFSSKKNKMYFAFKYQAWNLVSHSRLLFLTSGKLVHLFFLEDFIPLCLSKGLHKSRLTWKHCEDFDEYLSQDKVRFYEVEDGGMKGRLRR